MSKPTNPKATPKKKSKPAAASVVWFEIPADDVERARKFYGALFGWKIERFPAVPDYWHIDTGGEDASPDGGLLPRKHKTQPITSYVNVESAARAAAKVVRLGGKIMKPRTAVPGMGYFVICRDPEGNEFALWERNARAK